MAGRTAVILIGITVGWLFWPTTARYGAYACWSLAAVYAILTSHKRWI